MAPPTWMRLYAATGDERYLDFAVTNWWRTTDYLYDKDEHLFFRDSTFFDKREVNGQKVFWSRGNGWVMAGLVRVLQYLPMNHPDRPRFEQLFKDMAAKILTLPAARRPLAGEPARPGRLSGQGNQRFRLFHLRAGVGRESGPARPREI